MTAPGPHPLAEAPTPGTRPGAWAVEPLPQRAAYHRWILIGSVLVVGLSLVFQPGPEGHVLWPGTATSLPTLCMWKAATGVDCPGCGMTRCFVALAHGRLATAWRLHPVGVAVFVLLLSQIPYRVIQLRRLAKGRSELEHPLLAAVPWLVLGAMLGQWLLKMAGIVVLKP